MNHSINEVKIKKYAAGSFTSINDIVAIEEPLEIKLIHGDSNNKKTTDVSITMRTPGNDLELATGFLFTEGIINNISQLKINQADYSQQHVLNTIYILCNEDVIIDSKLLQRNFYTTSACGVCGKASIDAVFNLTQPNKSLKDFAVSKEVIIQLPELLKKHQDIFNHTGGIHAAALFDKVGTLLKMREDVGRHNALDKLIGSFFLQSNEHTIVPDKTILLLSGRASFELLQKSAMAGISIICAVGAPSSLAVETAERFGITLIGFLRNNRFNIYTNPHRIEW